ncbi:hypothetical protein KIW84_064270 [Lathyrus oleraceus]|uniref:Uncharacterized protein n=1 Tax=Pisum sativum TaxID=3888 RepID=A0A9D4WDW2_PEA|nr:hypothetical protein KIW84_064270 [Pisum sativum]
MLPFALHGYRTSVRTSTGATPFSLVYGMEVVLPVEVQIPSLRVLMDVKLQEAEWVRTRYEELSLIEEKRLAAICHGQLYQQRMKRAFDRKVRPRVYHVGDMVLKRILPPQNDRRGKWTPNYEGPFVVKKVFSGGALLLTTMDGKDFPSPVNADAEFALRRVRSGREYKVMNQKSPGKSGSSQNWKADMGIGYEYHGSTSRRVFSTRLSPFPSRVEMTNSPADPRSVDSLAGSGWLSPAGFRSMLPQSPGLKVAVSQRRVRWWFLPQQFPKRIGCRGGLSPARVAFFPTAVLFPSRVEIGVLTSSSAECLELPRRVP